jgi:hypothetical protein
MKRKIIFAASLVLISFTFTACEGMFQNCKFCKNVTYDNGSVISESEEAEYCGTDLLQKESTPDLVQGSIVIKVECR